MALRVDINPRLFAWACERARLDPADLQHRFKHLPAWESGEKKPTLKQLEAFADATHTPIGYFFMSEPPHEEVPIPDMRTIADQGIAEPSADLLDTIYLCQQRQEWYRDYAQRTHEARREFVGSANGKDRVETVAANMRRDLHFDLEERRNLSSWSDALRKFIGQADALGVLVMVSGVVGTNNRRKLNPGEFRGFALSDPLAPLVFINGADTKAAQMFTLAHELAHLWLGESALSEAEIIEPTHRIEKRCNAIAAELLVPLAMIRDEYDPAVDLQEETQRLAGNYKVSTLVILRRLHDGGLLSAGQYRKFYEQELKRLKEMMKKGGGGNFYLTQAARASRRFARAVVASTYEGQNSFTEAFRLLGVKKTETLRKFGDELGVFIGAKNLRYG